MLKNTLATMLLIIFLSIIPMFILKKKNSNKNFFKPFECGFNKMNKFKNSISINFLMFLFMFLILEFEVVIIIPMTKMKKEFMNSNMFILSISSLALIMMYEWKSNSIKWNK